MALFGNGELAIAQGVPQLDGTVSRAGDDLTVVGGEGDGKDIVGMADEAAGRHPSGEFPQSKGLIPGGRKSICTIRRDDLERKKEENPSVSIRFFISTLNEGGTKKKNKKNKKKRNDIRSPKRYGSDHVDYASGIHSVYRHGRDSR